MRRLQELAGSLRFRLTLWNTGVFAAMLLVLGVIYRSVLLYNLMAAIDRETETRARVVIQHWEQVPDAQKEIYLARVRQGKSLSPYSPFFFGVELTDLATDEKNGHKAYVYRPKILTLDRRDYLMGIPDQPWDEPAFRTASCGETVHATLSLDGRSVRLLSLPLRLQGHVEGVVQIVRSLEEVDRALAASLRTLLMLAPMTLLISGLAGVFLTGRALRPARDLRAAVETIEAEHLSLRLPVRGRNEFADLARTFNHMLDRLERAFQQQMRFTADASHELRTPLTVLRGNTSLALARSRSAEEYRDALERSQRAAESMSGLVEDLLLLARADSAQLLTESEPVSLAEILAATRSLFETGPVRTFVWDVAAERQGLCVPGNRGLLLRLFVNLLGNAVRHTAPEAVIRVHAAVDHSEVCITVQDTGDGISPEHLPHVCERFYRVDSARSAGQGGTGLGLSICRSIVEAHGGSLTIESEFGVGTTVTVRLRPCQTPEEAAACAILPDAPPPIGAHGSGAIVLSPDGTPGR